MTDNQVAQTAPTTAPSTAVPPPSGERRPASDVRITSPETTRRARRGRRSAVPLQSRTSTAYALRDDARRTVGYLRLVLGQSHISDSAAVSVDADRITIEWED